MREDFLHFVWRQARFDLRQLSTTTGESLSIQHFGSHNRDAGPDFSGSQIRLSGLQWAGNVEIHLRSSDWYAHGHDKDPAYDSVILHVVLEEDRPVLRPDGSRLPCLELRGRIPAGLLGSYWRLLHNEAWIPCQQQLYLTDTTTRERWLGHLLSERLAGRGQTFTMRWEAAGRDWEEAFYQLIARTLGGRVNTEPMDMLARSLPLRILLKHKHSLLQLEALLFGQSGLLPEREEGEAEYVTLLRREYRLLRIKYGLRPLPATAWRYLRLRPNNFPTVRIAQLAALLYRTGQLFGKALAAANAREITNMFVVELSNYWRNHYRFGKAGTAGKRRLGATTVRSLLINAVAPALLAYGTYRLDDRYRERATALLAELPAEDNKIIRNWQKLGMVVTSAAQSQALLELKQAYCDHTRCTDCALGCEILRQPYDPERAGPLLTSNEQAQVYALAGNS